jgi:nitrite reductase (cytochrome c-552)
LFDKLMEGYGFTKEHAEPRSHAFMLVDQWAVDRAFGGRMQFKDWTYINKAELAANSAWNVMVDIEPSTDDQKTLHASDRDRGESGVHELQDAGSHPGLEVHGRQGSEAKWDRTSKPVEFARAMKHPLNCFMCHDPHSAGPRVVRDALIQAVVDRKLGTYPMDPVKSKQTTMTKVTFQRDGKDFRAIGLLSKADSNLMCAQCHVEYNCGPGFDCPTRTTTHRSAWRSAYQPVPVGQRVRLQESHDRGQNKFKDFKHNRTGAYLPKIQHPELETFWGSKHERAGVECKDCHMPRRSMANGKVTTNHQQMSPRYQIKESCLTCHKEWNEKDALYHISAIQGYTKWQVWPRPNTGWPS